MIICPPYYNYICILFQLHKHRVQSTHLNEKSRQIFQNLSWLVSPCRTQANKPKLSFTIVFRNVDSGAKQSAAQRCEHRQLKYKIFGQNRDQEWQILYQKSDAGPQQPAAADTKLQNKIVIGGGVRTEDCAWLRVSVLTLLLPRYCAALQHRRRAEIWRFHPRMMVNRRNSISAPLCECLHSEAMPINSAFVAPKQLNMSQAAACSLLELDTAGQSAERVNRIENQCPEFCADFIFQPR